MEKRQIIVYNSRKEKLCLKADIQESTGYFVCNLIAQKYLASWIGSETSKLRRWEFHHEFFWLDINLKVFNCNPYDTSNIFKDKY